MIDPNRREMFTDLYRMAEYYEKPPFQPGDIDGNADWFVKANEEWFIPFCQKHPGQLALDLAMAVLEDANRQAVEANKAEVAEQMNFLGDVL